MEEDTVLYDHKIPAFHKLAVGTMEACSWLCHREDQCAFWTYDTAKKLCYLKSGYNSGQSGAFKSGQKNACGASSGELLLNVSLEMVDCCGGCGNWMEEGVGYPGNDLRSVSDVASPEECARSERMMMMRMMMMIRMMTKMRWILGPVQALQGGRGLSLLGDGRIEGLSPQDL